MKELTLLSITFILGVMTGSYYKPKAKEQTKKTHYAPTCLEKFKPSLVYQYSYR